MSDISIEKSIKEDFIFLVNKIESNFNLSLEISYLILDEVNEQFAKMINRYNMSESHESKLTSLIAFWIRKLKPIHHGSDSIQHYRCINEFCGLLFSMMIYANNNRKNKINTEALINLSKIDRIFQDLIKNYRYNSHSSHSLTIIFELLFNYKSNNMPKVANKERK